MYYLQVIDVIVHVQACGIIIIIISVKTLNNILLGDLTQKNISSNKNLVHVF
jgi:hypothetical protein